MEIRIDNKRPTLLGTCTGRSLKPGHNTPQDTLRGLDAKELATLESDPSFRHWVKAGWVEVIKGPSSAVDPESVREKRIQVLKGRNAQTALKSVKVESDLELLALWYEQEERKSVKDAILARITDIESGNQDKTKPAIEGVDEVFGDGTEEA